MKTDSKLAQKYGASVRTIARWRHDGAPLHDHKRMRAWIAGRKNMPAGTHRKLAATRRRERSKGPSELPELGAAHALARLEKAEARAFADMERALATGDPISIRDCRNGWLRVSEALRKQDLAIEQDRRDSGELVQRSESERVIAAFTLACGAGMERALYAATNRLRGLTEEREIFSILQGACRETFVAAAGALRSWPFEQKSVPPWAVSAAE